MKIKASVLEEQKSQLRFQMLDLIESRAKEVRIKMVGSGVCHTDIAHAKNEFNMKLNTPIVPRSKSATMSLFQIRTAEYAMSA